ncbi:HAD-IIIC family phosphatase [Butyrivibrio sp. TB]|uniref:HAD-IIIC family phosphatase n=1 Tax=Butyrivibrio sp. TB TaxID=1520809 RepID=UPI0008D10B42|nr:HAD-IIIC family phosphatase [Butyrivibrio sp. TB]SEQ40592.1 HAD-superfamily phosphatase, subfamily IIIC/FkbH-like domain-containing protein [Butyrivibrio sp. TB]
MDYFSYPLDTKTLIRKKLAIKNELLEQNHSWITKRIAVLGGSTTNEVVDQLELALLHYGIKAEFYQSEYGKYWEDGMFGNPALDGFAPDIIYIHTNWRNVKEFPSISDTEESVDKILDNEYTRFEQLWNSIKEKYQCPIIQNNFDRPDYRLMGNRDIWDYRGRSNFLSRLNQKFYLYAREHTSFYINDLDYIAQNFGLAEWSNSLYWNMYKYMCPMNAIPYLSFSIANIIKSLFGKNKKLIALDLDNTIWGGVIGDDGLEGIKIGKETPQGQSYYYFQKYCKELQKIGVVLAVNSKNDEDNAIAGLKHPEGVLRPDDFVSIKANWNNKDQNLRELADELSLGIDSFVFVDDNPAEREIIKNRLPAVAVPDMDVAENYIKILDESGYFETTTITEDDLSKTSQYKARAQAKKEQAVYENYDDYLKSLEMKAVVTEFDPICIQRIAQLTNKTNQFNLTTLRCSEDDIRHMQNAPDYICLCGRLIDKFADNGIVTVVSGKIKDDSLHIELWLMSCRVFKRGLEDLMMNELVKIVRNTNIRRIVGYYKPTPKNGLVKDFYSNMGFSFVKEESNGSTIWELDTLSYEMHTTMISMSSLWL